MDDDDELRDIIRRILDDYGQGVCNDPQRVEALLRDFIPESRVKIVALTAAVREGIVEGLLAVGNETPPPSLGERYVRWLRENLGLADHWAYWAVRMWSSALSVSLELPSVLASAPGAAPSVAGWIGSVEMDVDVEKRISDLVDEATRTAADISDNASHALALGMVATALAGADSDQTRGLIRQAATQVKSIDNENARTHACHDLSITVSGADPGCAEELAFSIGGLLRDDALSHLAIVLAAEDFDRAMRVTRSISHHGLNMYTMNRLITVLAPGDPKRAERLARRLSDGYWRLEALCHISSALNLDTPARGDSLLDEAETLAQSLGDKAAKGCALGSVARVRAFTDPYRAAQLFDQAQQLARSSTEAVKDAVLGSLAVALAPSDPDRAVDLLQRLDDCSYAVGEVAKTVAPIDPARALRLADSFPVESPQLADLAVALAVNDSDGALALAGSIPSERWKFSAVVGIAQALAPVTPTRSARLLDDAEGKIKEMAGNLDKVGALIDVAAAWSRW
jgi:hypothetical protein